MTDPKTAFREVVAWIRDLAVAKDCPGVITGISGTDSVVAYLACAHAFNELGKPERVVGVHYGQPFPPENKTPAEIDRLLNISPDYNWVARTLVPWLREQAPQSQIVIDAAPDKRDDHARWADIFRRSLNGAAKTEHMPKGHNMWVVGTRNATEQALGTYSNLSAAASVQPLVRLWKSDILAICRDLNVPDVAIRKSRQVDCDCGRYDLAADHIEEVDLLLKRRHRQVDEKTVANALPPDLREKLDAFIDEQTAYAAFKREIPYMPPAPARP